MGDKTDRVKGGSVQGPKKRRIDTQIHRRKKVKTTGPLEAEWDVQSGAPPSNLRTPSDKMKK